MLTRTLTLLVALAATHLFASYALAQATGQEPLVDPFVAPQTRARETPEDLVPWETRELSPRDRQLARELFQQGVAASQGNRWDEAQDAFSRVYALTHRAEVLLNLATAQAQTGAMLNAIESYRRFLQTASAALQTQHGDEARAALADVEASIPRLRIEAPITSSELVMLDGVSLSPAELGVALPMDPGAHRIALARGTEVLDAQSVTLERGESRTVTLSLDEAEPSALPHTTSPSEDLTMQGTAPAHAGPDAGLIGLGVSVGVIAIAGVVVAILFATQPAEDPGYSGSLGRVTSDASQPYMGTLASWDAL